MLNALRTLSAKWQKANQPIERERLMLDTGKIVLLKDLAECFKAGAPASGAPTRLKKLQMRYANDAEDGPRILSFQIFTPLLDRSGHFETYLDGGRVCLLETRSGPNSDLERLVEKLGQPDMTVPAALLPEEARLRCLAPQAKAAEAYEAAERAFETAPTAENLWSLRQAEIFQRAYAKAYPLYENAVELAPVLQAIDAAHPTGHLFDVAKYLSLAHGEGKAVADFWHAVNALDDYSHLFPRHQPTNGKRDRSRSENAAWRPAAVGAF